MGASAAQPAPAMNPHKKQRALYPLRNIEVETQGFSINFCIGDVAISHVAEFRPLVEGLLASAGC